METIVEVKTMQELFVDLKNEKLVKFMNDPEILVRIKFLEFSTNYEDRSCKLELHFSKKQGKKMFERDYIINARLTTTLFRWFTKPTTVYTPDGVATDKKLSNFQKYKLNNGIPSDVKLYDMVFESRNNSANYKDNPFRITIDTRQGRNNVTLYGVMESHYQMATKFDPMTGEDIRVFYKPKREDNGQVLTLSREKYIRLEVR